MNIGTETAGGAVVTTLLNLFVKPVADAAVLASRPRPSDVNWTDISGENRRNSTITF